MTTAARKILVLVGLGVLVAGLLGWQITRLTQPRPFSIRSARLTKLDAAARSGEIEFVHPKSGRPTTVVAQEIPRDCEISIDGRRADVSELRVGDTVAARGLFYPWDQTARPQSIQVTRPAPATSSAPGSASAPGTP